MGFQEIPEDTAAAGWVGVEAAGAAPKGQGKNAEGVWDSGGGFDSGACSSASSGYFSWFPVTSPSC